MDTLPSLFVKQAVILLFVTVPIVFRSRPFFADKKGACAGPAPLEMRRPIFLTIFSMFSAWNTERQDQWGAN